MTRDPATGRFVSKAKMADKVIYPGGYIGELERRGWTVLDDRYLGHDVWQLRSPTGAVRATAFPEELLRAPKPDRPDDLSGNMRVGGGAYAADIVADVQRRYPKIMGALRDSEMADERNRTLDAAVRAVFGQVDPWAAHHAQRCPGCVAAVRAEFGRLWVDG